MRRFFSPVACAAAILLSSVSVDAILAPATAQGEMSIDFDTFHDQLSGYGDWVYSDRWGEVWIPDNVPGDFRPYDTNGYWANTDEYGWTWVSNYEWGDIPFHYGRWVNDPDAGWLWIPGYVWSPAWVAWRSNGQYTGWMPMPPDPQFLGESGPSVGISFGGGIGVSIDFNNTGNYYGYSQWYGPSYNDDRFASMWVFVGTGHMGDRYSDRHRYEAPRGNYVSIIRNTKNITNYTVVNNYIVNRSVNVNVVERAGGHVQTVHVADVIRKPQFIMRADQGRQVQQRMRTEMPRGTGTPNSAPKPSPKTVQSLSTKVTARGGNPGAHLFTRNTITKAALPEKPGGAVPPPGGKTGTTPATAPAGNGMMGEHGKHTLPIPPTTAGPTATTPPPTNGPGQRERHVPAILPTTAGPTATTPSGTPPANGPGERDRHMHTPPGATTPAAIAPATTPPTSTTTPTTRRHGNEMGGPANPATTPPTTPPSEMMRRPGAEKFGPATTTPTPPATTPPATGEPRSIMHRENPNAGPANPPNAAPPVVHAKPVTPPPPTPEDKDKKKKPDEPGQH